MIKEKNRFIEIGDNYINTDKITSIYNGHISKTIIEFDKDNCYETDLTKTEIMNKIYELDGKKLVVKKPVSKKDDDIFKDVNFEELF